MRQLRYWLIVPIDGAPRIVQRTPRLTEGEVAFRLIVEIPHGWGACLPPELRVTLPEPPAALIVHEPVTSEAS